ncbi:single-stranded-DNA-specific exonuclease RecJ [Psychrobacter sp. I-STPA6b]|uniref:single-stranded-DNA-specific exonuclease RecJ n=1 Tax=Psychrobacter sp. I-STPA6b TaxID=2585718 RepID=UPI001D0CBBA0|nr:single-stranded-DNA-specific exonuclease RecJ [Psychrobacter sp. I-STPA6b]
MLNLTPRYTGTFPDNLPDTLAELAKESPTLARLFIGRGITHRDELDHQLTALLRADELLGIDTAVNLLDTAIDEQKRILIVGDFDCDGATSTALMLRVLSQMGAQVDFVVPNRFKYGYGLTPEIVQLAIDDYQPDMIVTVDNGISSHAGVDKAKMAGIDVIITDHHLTTKPTPKADAVVNPNQLGCHFASKSLVGVGVAFYLLGRLAKQRRQSGKSSAQVSQYLDLVALGTIADVGMLDHNNRILVHHGLQAIRTGRCCAGISALLEQAGRDPEKITAQDFGFVLGPRINAAGRMDNMRIGIECLTTDDPKLASQLAYQLDKLNQTRRHVESDMREQADNIISTLSAQPNAESAIDTTTNTQQIASKSLILYQDDWHQGVIGIVAGRLKETYYRPSIIFAPADPKKTGDTDIIKGSARSITGIHIRDAIEQVAEQNPELISHFGGHAMAAGLSIQRKNFTAFADAFESIMQKMDNTLFEEQKLTDGQLEPQDFSLAFVDILKHASIWGNGFAPPIFDGVFTVIQHRILKDKHLKLSLQYPHVQYPIDAIWFNYDSNIWSYQAQRVHILFELDINEWNGQQSLQLMVKDLAVI